MRIKTKPCEKNRDEMDMIECPPEGHPDTIAEVKRNGLGDQGSLQLSNAIIDLAPNVIVGLGESAEILVFNRYAEQLTGYRAEEVIGKPWIETFIPQELRDEIQGVWSCVVREKKIAHHHENPIITKGGQQRLIAWSNMVLATDGAFNMVISIGKDVTERHEAEEAVRGSEERYRSLFETTHEAIGASGPDGRISNANPAMARLLGLKSPEDLIGRPAVALYADLAARRILFAELKKRGYVENFELTLVKQDGSGDNVHILGNATLHTDEKGGILRAEFIFSDITERKRAVEALRESEEKYRTLTDNVDVGIYRNTSGAEGKFIEANPAIVQIFGYSSKEEFINVNVSQLYQDPDRRQMFNGKMLENGYVKNEEVLLKRKDGTPFWGSVTAVAIHDEKGRVKYYDGVIEDVTARKQVEMDLKIKDSAIESSINAIGITDLQGKILYVNNSLVKMWGFKRRDEVLGRALIEFWEGEGILETVKELFKTGSKVGVDVGKRDDGSVFPVQFAASMIKDEDGNPMYMLGSFLDITEGKRAEEILKASEERYRTIFEASPEAILLVDDKGKLLSVNNRLRDWLDYDSEEMVGKNILELPFISGDGRTIIKENFGRRMRGEPVQPYEIDFIGREGRKRVGRIHGTVLKDEKGRVIGDLVMVSDVTERKQAEEEVQCSLKRLQKLIEGIINTMSITVETRDQYTAGHQRRVAQLGRAIADEMKLSEEVSESIYMAALIHDIGKISIPAEILSKPTRLSEVEFSIIETHPQVGYDILKGIDFPWPIAEIVLKHHERVNGSGYPQGLSGKEIPLEAKILSVADVVEAMASHRPYRASLGIGKALEEITQNKGKLYDEEVVKACLKVFYDQKFSFDK